MKIVIVSNDFRVYWKGRLIYLQNYLASLNIDLYAIELFGKGSPYSFDSYEDKQLWWTCLFPQKSAGELSDKEIKKQLFEVCNHVDKHKCTVSGALAPLIAFCASAHL